MAKQKKILEQSNIARMHFITKDYTDEPELKRIRPIAIYSPIRKLIEIKVDSLDKETMWQWYTRPG